MTTGDWNIETGVSIPISNGSITAHSYDVVTLSSSQDTIDLVAPVNAQLDALFTELSKMTMNEALTDERPQIRGLAKFIQRSISENATSEPRSRDKLCESKSDVKS